MWKQERLEESETDIKSTAIEWRVCGIVHGEHQGRKMPREDLRKVRKIKDEAINVI